MKPTFPSSLYAAVFAVAVASLPVAAQAMGDEEFVGPFASWANVKTGYGAAGDGVTDDTAAIQKALNALGPTNSTLYFPAGTYRITQTLNMAAQLYVNIIGQDPATTTILWTGTSGGTMLYINGVAYSRFDRLTFNGQGSAAVAVDQSWTGSGGNFDTGNEYADDVFENAGTGFRCGNLGYGCAETSMLRDQFLNNTVGGVDTMNFNALDMFIWYSLFQNNAEGVSNALGAGNFHVYQSIFQNSTAADIHIGNAGPFNFRNNYSIGSNRFGLIGGSCSPYNITIQGNTILDTTQSDAIIFAGLGPHLLIDNVVRSLPAATGPVVREQSCNFSDLFSMGNTFTVSSPEAPNPNGGHYHSVQDQVVARSTINPTMPTLPGTPPNNNRQIFEASPTGSGTLCTAASPCSVQQAITNAANAEQSGAVHPVAHIAAGAYNIRSTITVPATVNSGIQIIGDSGYSRLTWTGTGTGPVIQLLGPSKAILRDFLLEGNGASVDGIDVTDADQAGSRVFMEQPILSRSNNLFVDGLDYTDVELHDFYHLTSPTGKTSVNVTGGPSAAAGLWRGGATNIFAGASTENYLSYGVANGAHVAVQGIWNDGGAGQAAVANITGTSTFSYAGSALNLPSGTPLAISLDNFQGTAALLNLYTPNGGVEITGNGGAANVLGLGLVGPSTTFFSNTTSPAAVTEFLNGQTTANPPPGTGSSAVPEQPTTPNPSFLTATLNQVRTEQPTLLASLPGGVTDVRLYRVSVDDFTTGIHLKGDPAVSPDGTTISAPTGSLVTSAGTWTFGTAQQTGEPGQYQILLNGGTKWPAGQGYAAKMEAANGGQLYTYNSFVNGWWIWRGGVWAKSAAP